MSVAEFSCSTTVAGQQLQLAILVRRGETRCTTRNETLTRALTPIDCNWWPPIAARYTTRARTGAAHPLTTHQIPGHSSGDWESREGRIRSLVTSSPPDFLSSPSAASSSQSSPTRSPFSGAPLPYSCLAVASCFCALQLHPMSAFSKPCLKRPNCQHGNCLRRFVCRRLPRDRIASTKDPEAIEDWFG